MSELYLMTSIVARAYAADFSQFYQEHHLVSGFNTYGSGAATSKILDRVGLEDDNKSLFFSVITRENWPAFKESLRREMDIDSPGVGIVFVIPISSVAGKKQLQFLVQGQDFVKGEESELKNTNVELIVAIANYGFNDLVMNAANEGGASGGTVLHGKGIGLKQAEQFFGVSFVSEKEIILIVTRREQRNAIMSSVMEKAGTGSKAGTIMFSLPISGVAGIRAMEDALEE